MTIESGLIRRFIITLQTGKSDKTKQNVSMISYLFAALFEFDI